MIELYGLKVCGTCKKALAWLEAHGVPHRFIDYREQPVPPETLRAWARVVPWEKLVNRSGPTWRNLPEARKNPRGEGDWLALIRDYPALVRRPVVTRDGQLLAVGFSEKRFAELCGR
ncbi:MAG: Spx/MgsR family RNA polymerase-binding regulatory protein [Xanthomonadales bacterium]|nr:Spx/MgsR family RNA polymerase-binding regulatory protein [Xanthomonadales bacterium]